MIKIDWRRYEELQKKSYSELNEEEKEFFKYMYHAEEFASGLDSADL